MALEQEIKAAMQAAVDHLKQELKGLRSGRANPALLDSVRVEVYGSSMRLRDIANITTPEPRQLLITPYDHANASLIGKGIELANLNLQPLIEGGIVRINIPPMNEELRKEICKQCKKKGEDAKIVIREVRRKYNDLVRKQKEKGEIPEDQLKKYENLIQKLTDISCKESDALCAVKEKEILEI